MPREVPELVYGDAIETMQMMPDACVDLITADLPYGCTKEGWDTCLPMDELWRQFRRILAPRGNIVATAANAFTHQLAAAAPDMLKMEGIWLKTRTSQFQHARARWLVNHENILVFSHGKIKSKGADRMKFNPIGSRDVKVASHPPRKTRAMGDITRNRVGKLHVQRADYATSVMYHPNPHKPEHSTQKPESLMEQLIGTFSDPGDQVFDPTMGSGTAGVAAWRLGREFFGIEPDRHYFEYAQARIMAEVANPSPSKLAELWGVDEVAGLMTPMNFRTVEDFANDDELELLMAAE